MDYPTPHSCRHCEGIVVSRPEDNPDFYEGSKPRQSLLLLKILLALRSIGYSEYDDILRQGSDDEHAAFLRRILRMLWDKVPLLEKLEAGLDLHEDFEIGEFLLPLRILRAFYEYLMSGDYPNLHQDSEPRQSLYLLRTLREHYLYCISPKIDLSFDPKACIRLLRQLQKPKHLEGFLDWLEGSFYLEIDLKGLDECEFLGLFRHDPMYLIEKSHNPRGEDPRQASWVVAVSLGRSTVKIGNPYSPINEKYLDAKVYTMYWIFTEKDSSIAGKFESPPSINISSEAAFAQVWDWLQDCIHNHPRCPRVTNQFSPTRLLKIWVHQDERLIQLKESREIEETDVRYAALSYCWGGEQNIRTTKSTLHTFQMRIDFQSLPKTVQDAVIVTEKLGIQYLWIDAFCIIQDDETDKAREIDSMRHVYENAEVTIAASRAGRVCEGFLQDLEPYKPESSPFSIGYRDLTDQINPVVIVQKRMSVPRGRLSARAWAFQERLFSHRILEYGSKCVHWSCQTHGDCDRQGGKCDDLWWRRGFSEISRRLRDRSTLAVDDWYHVVGELSGKFVSDTRDRLPAIAGIAEHFGSAGGFGEYLAGIWQSSFPRGLLWRVVLPPEPSQPGSSTLAPSWSWASTTEAVSYGPFEYVTPIHKAELIKVSINRGVEGASYGRVLSGDLTLRGFIAQVFWKLPKKGTYLVHDNDSEFTQGSRIIPAEIYWDVRTEGSRDSTGIICVHLLILASSLRKPAIHIITGLVLQKRRDHKYLRLGVFEIKKDSWVCHSTGSRSVEGSTEEVTIV